MFLCGNVLASTAAPATSGAQEGAIHLPYPHPVIPDHANWAGATVLVILGMFLMAAGVGVVVRLNAPEELPVTHSHDEPPGASHHHDHHGHGHGAGHH